MAAPIQNINGEFTLLRGRQDYRLWAQAFQTAAETKGFWDLYTGIEKVLPKPDLAHCRNRIRAAKRPFFAQLAIEIYNDNLSYFQDQQERLDEARNFITLAIDPAIRQHIWKYQHPADVWTALHNVFSPAMHPQEIAMHKFFDLQLKDCNNVMEFLDELFLIREELINEGGNCTEENLKLKILTSLTPEYTPHVIQEISTAMIANGSVQDLAQYLLDCEQRVMQRVAAEGAW